MASARPAPERTTGESKSAGPCDVAGDPARIALNREDALSLLAGLGWPDRPFGTFVALPTVDGKLVQLPGGIRKSEIDELAAQLAPRFSVLVELRSADAKSAVGYVRWDDIAKLVFRSEADRDAFVYRPVAEFDPSSTQVAVDPSLFGLEGPPRFVVAKIAAEDRAAESSDRLGGGVAVLAHLLARRPGLLDAAAALLGKRSRDSSYDGILDGLICRFAGLERSPLPDALGCIADGFVAARGATGRELARDLFDRMTDGATDVGAESIEARWYGRALDLFDNRTELDGREFGDERRIDLRAALLAAHAGRLDALETTLDLPTPAGATVVALAGFLMGLSVGLRGLDWQIKRNVPGALSEVAAACYRSLRSGIVPPGKFALHRGERVVLAFDGNELASAPASTTKRTAPVAPPPPPYAPPPERPSQPAPTGMSSAIAEALRQPFVDVAAYSDGWRPVVLPDDKEAESKETVVEGRTVLVHLRRRLEPKSAAAKAAGLLAENLEPGVGWRLGMAGKDCYAVVDIPAGIGDAELEALWRALAELERRFVKQRPAKRIRSKATAKKAQQPG